MPNKIIASVLVASALSFGVQSFAQAPVAEPANKSPNMSPADTVKPPDTPAERIAPKSGTGIGDTHSPRKSKSRHKSKPKGSEPRNDGVTTPSNGTSSSSSGSGGQ